MIRGHALHTAVHNSIATNYFYTKEKNDSNGNPRYKLYIIDPDAPAVYEILFNGYESQINDYVAQLMDRFNVSSDIIHLVVCISSSSFVIVFLSLGVNFFMSCLIISSRLAEQYLK